MLNIGVKGRKKQLYTKMKYTLDHFTNLLEGTFSERYSFNQEIFIVQKKNKKNKNKLKIKPQQWRQIVMIEYCELVRWEKQKST